MVSALDVGGGVLSSITGQDAIVPIFQVRHLRWGRPNHSGVKIPIGSRSDWRRPIWLQDCERRALNPAAYRGRTTTRTWIDGWIQQRWRPLSAVQSAERQIQVQAAGRNAAVSRGSLRPQHLLCMGKSRVQPSSSHPITGTLEGCSPAPYSDGSLQETAGYYVRNQ